MTDDNKNVVLFNLQTVMVDYWIYIFLIEANSNQKRNFLVYKSVK